MRKKGGNKKTEIWEGIVFDRNGRDVTKLTVKGDESKARKMTRNWVEENESSYNLGPEIDDGGFMDKIGNLSAAKKPVVLVKRRDKRDDVKINMANPSGYVSAGVETCPVCLRTMASRAPSVSHYKGHVKRGELMQTKFGSVDLRWRTQDGTEFQFGIRGIDPKGDQKYKEEQRRLWKQKMDQSRK